MTQSTATFSSPRASVYLQQMCKHFGHKVPVDFTAEHGRIELPFGTCKMTAQGDTLTMIVEGEAEQIGKLEKVIGDHMVRFAFREEPSITWRINA